MSELQDRSVLSVDQFARDELQDLFMVAQALKRVSDGTHECSALRGAVLANLFFEPSTRTRTSFGSAFLRLGGQILETADESFSSLVKGESLADTARVISGYADVVVMRHSVAGSVSDFAAHSDRPVINAGDGGGEHPTQALLDAFTIASELGRDDYSLDGISIAMVGDLKYGRTVHSLAKLLGRAYKNVSFHLASPTEDLAMPRDIVIGLQKAGHEVNESRHLREVLGEVDVIYATRIQEERLPDPAVVGQYRGRLSIDKAAYERWTDKKRRPVLMHPLPRDSRVEPMELTADLEDLPQFAVFRQAHNGVPVRMALFASVMDLDLGYLDSTIDAHTFRERQRIWRGEHQAETDNVRALAPAQRTKRKATVTSDGQLSLDEPEKRQAS
jgi:aspartate carbamoyltransferase catalytic subunit